MPPRMPTYACPPAPARRPFAVVACVGVAEHARAWCRDPTTEAAGRSLRAVLADGIASAALARHLAEAFESKAIAAW